MTYDQIERVALVAWFVILAVLMAGIAVHQVRTHRLRKPIRITHGVARGRHRVVDAHQEEL